ncbi:uncharacterized protein A1O9_07115 [Exophiala aquamarina CBS 119918]|uniref:Xylanolytic transcriptional activator regulatory domain-containing protein n=1 Tax=Exophiala aquamarina CBS 119918 TaxID=1182545 RepID=A0A072PN21_9EURO|nr:uncharacterized protein A1O9_07115 [Exophiala aquamarina CBS 119918]KEF56925.1 hypothetical protein A1O9_07115 [Exophiala aquamarina CBS 119918]
MLTAQLHGTNSGHQDPSWYATYNTVLAFGCRITLAKTLSYSKTVEASMAFFENALSVQSDILQCRSSIISVRALTLMAYYTEAIGSPHLEYILASNAMRLAISKGLHRQPATSWNISEQDTRQRNRLFWNIYALDRQISHRSGRPPAIDDDDISCQVPNTLSPGENINIPFTTICVKLHQILSHAYKRLSTARALQQSTAELLKAVTELDQELVTFKQSIEHLITLDEPLDEQRVLATMPTFQLLMLHFLYYGLLFEIHGPLMLPWFDCTMIKQLESFRSQVDRSCALVAKTARAAILATRLVRLDANCPVLDPTSETVQSDLKLMEIAAGYGSRVEFESDGSISCTFIREFTHFAYTAVDRAKLHLSHHGVPDPESADVGGVPVDGGESLMDVDLSSYDQQYFREVSHLPCTAIGVPTKFSV